MHKTSVDAEVDLRLCCEQHVCSSHKLNMNASIIKIIDNLNVIWHKPSDIIGFIDIY